MEGALAADAAPASCTPPLRGGSPASRRGDARASEYLSRRRRQPAASLRPPRSVSCDFAVSVLAVRPSFALFSVIPSPSCPVVILSEAKDLLSSVRRHSAAQDRLCEGSAPFAPSGALRQV